MKLTLEPTHNKETHNKDLLKVIIETPCDYLDIHDLMQDVIKPALLAWGFQPKSINEYIEQE